MISMSAQNDQLFDVNSLPSMPGTLLKLNDLFNDIDVNTDQILEIIKTDPALTCKVIALANSVPECKYNLLQEFDKLQYVLSIDVLKTITVTAMIQQYFAHFSEQNNHYSGLLWQASIRCAYTSRALARLVGYKNENETYLAGLLHCLGQLSLLANYETVYTKMLDQSNSLDEQNVGELKLANLTSPELTSKLISGWDKDSFIADAIIYQHEPAEAIVETTALIKIVNLAVKMSKDSLDQESIYADAQQLFGLSKAQIKELLNEVILDVEVISEQLGIYSDKSYAKTAYNEASRTALGDRVRNTALVNSLQMPPVEIGDEDKDKVLNIMQDIGMLFDLRHCIWFNYNDNNKNLLGYIDNRMTITRVQEFKLDVEKSHSLVAQSLLKRKSISTFDLHKEKSLTVIDQQLVKLLQAEGIIAMPFIYANVQLGVMVAGISQAHALSLQNNNNNLLAEFIYKASELLLKQLDLREQQNKILEEQAAVEKLRIKKLVHEANNPLAIMRNYLRILSIKLQQSDESVTEQLEILVNEVERVSKTLSHIRDDVITAEIDSGMVDIHGLINESVMIFSKSLFSTYDIDYKMDFDEKIPVIESNAGNIKQVLTNLIKNAVEAMPEGGEIVFKTRDRVNFNGTEYIELTITDNGPGIPDKIMQNIFEPVKSTKDDTHSGLGLTIVKNLLTNLGGGIRCNNLPQRGVEFGILLPRIIKKDGEV